MSDSNTLLLTNRITQYIPGSQLGEGNIFNVFSPNFANAQNNFVFDVSGSTRISENVIVENNLTSYLILNGLNLMEIVYF